MQFSQLATILAVAASVNAVALPDTNNWKTTEACPTTTSTAWVTSTAWTTSSTWGKETPTTTKTWGDKTPTTTSKPWGDKTTSSTWGGAGTPTTSSWGPTSTGTSVCCKDGSYSYEGSDQCSSEGGEPYECTTIGLVSSYFASWRTLRTDISLSSTCSTVSAC